MIRIKAVIVFVLIQFGFLVSACQNEEGQKIEHENLILKEPVVSSETLDNKSVPTEKDYEARVNSYLEAVRINNLAAAYRMVAAKEDGALSPLEFKMNVLPPNSVLIDYEVQSISVEGEKAKAVVMMTYKSSEQKKPYKAERKFEWIRTDNGIFLQMPINRKSGLINSLKDKQHH